MSAPCFECLGQGGRRCKGGWRAQPRQLDKRLTVVSFTHLDNHLTFVSFTHPDKRLTIISFHAQVLYSTRQKAPQTVTERAVSPFIFNAEQQPINVPDQAQFWHKPEVRVWGLGFSREQQQSSTEVLRGSVRYYFSGEPAL